MDQSIAMWSAEFPEGASSIMQFTLMVGAIEVEGTEEGVMPGDVPWFFGRIIMKEYLGVTPRSFSVRGAWYCGRLYLRYSQSETASTASRHLFGEESSCVVTDMRDSSIRWKYLGGQIFTLNPSPSNG